MNGRTCGYTVTNAARDSKEWLQQHGVASAFVAGRIGSSAGGVVVSSGDTADKAYRLITQSSSAAPQNIRVPVQLTAVAANVIVNMATRTTPIYRFFSEGDSDGNYTIEIPGEAVNLFDNHDEEPGWFSGWTLPEFETKWNGVLIFIRVMLYVSLGFMFLNTTFSTMKLFELFLHLFSSADASVTVIVIEIIIALFCAVSNAIATLSLNIPMSLKNVMGVIRDVKEGKAKFTPAIAATACVGILNLIATVFGTYYNTANAFARYKKMIAFLDVILTETLTKSIILLSTGGAVVSEISRLSSLYDLITKLATKFSDYFSSVNNKPGEASDTLEEPPSYWNKLKILVMVAAGFDSLFAGLVNFNSIPFAIKDLTNIDPDNGILKATSIGTGISTASVTFAFTWRGTQLHEEYLINSKKKAAEIAQLESVHIDMDDSDEELRPLINKSKSSHPAIELNEIVIENEDDKDSVIDIAKLGEGSYKKNNNCLFGNCFTRNKTAAEFEEEYQQLITGNGAKYIS